MQLPECKRSIKIAVIDDDPVDRKLIRLAFSKSNVAVDLDMYDGGAPALDNLQKQSSAQLPDGCIVDINMPGMSGIELLKKIKTNDMLQHIPIVVFSSSDRYEDIRSSYKEQAAGYIKKPEQHSELQDVVCSLTELWGKHMRFVSAVR